MIREKQDLEEIEIQLFLEGVYRLYGWDFRDYAMASLKRRIWKYVQDNKLKTISSLQDKVLHNPSAMEGFLLTVSIDVTSMYRDPEFYLAFRQKAVPFLKEYPFVRIWHVGCSAGEEVYSMAILLQEEKLYDKCRLYATDMNDALLQKAKTGIISHAKMKEYSDNYLQAGGEKTLSSYNTASDQNVIFHKSLTRNIVWSQHNLVTDYMFNEFQVILCRNVMIYFNNSLQARVHKLLYDSLAIGGILGLGSKESLNFTPYKDCYEDLDESMKLYRKVK